MAEMKISELAKRGGVTVETIRFYQRKGLIDRPVRPLSGFRTYSEESLARVRFIRSAKELGFSLKEIAELLSLRLHLNASCLAVKEQAQDKISDIERKMAVLGRMKAALSDLVESCSGKGPMRKCPILDSLEGNRKGDLMDRKEK